MASLDVDVREVVRDAARFHGHLGPFLVLGVKMGLAVVNSLGKDGLEGKVAVRLVPPFSCVIDGVQFSTHCTVGNRRLSVENSDDEISGQFVVADSGRGLRACVRSDWMKGLLGEISKGVSLEELAWEVSALGDEELFRIEAFQR
jgi:formylmethanofuran dehydrogenase subunit E